MTLFDLTVTNVNSRFPFENTNIIGDQYNGNMQRVSTFYQVLQFHPAGTNQ